MGCPRGIDSWGAVSGWSHLDNLLRRELIRIVGFEICEGLPQQSRRRIIPLTDLPTKADEQDAWRLILILEVKGKTWRERNCFGSVLGGFASKSSAYIPPQLAQCDLRPELLCGSTVVLHLVLSAGCCAGPAAPTEEWPTYGNDPGSSRYSPLSEITKDNVGDLKVAWTYRTGDMSDAQARGTGKRFGPKAHLRQHP